MYSIHWTRQVLRGLTFISPSGKYNIYWGEEKEDEDPNSLRKWMGVAREGDGVGLSPSLAPGTHIYSSVISHLTKTPSLTLPPSLSPPTLFSQKYLSQAVSPTTPIFGATPFHPLGAPPRKCRALSLVK